jgi:Na+/H+-translocating membrane pyrophosphatase
MAELSPEYFKIISEQLVLISVFLGGISTTILGTIIMQESESKILKFMILALSLSAVSFIVAVIGMTKVQVILAPDSPYLNKEDALFYPRLIGGLAFYLGIYSLLTVVGSTGWMKSKRIGIFTTTLAIISGLLISTLT